jgi:hypothetical protein
VAPPGSDKTAQLIAAGSRRDASGELYYTQEFTVQSPRFFRHNLAGEGVQEGHDTAVLLHALLLLVPPGPCPLLLVEGAFPQQH